MLDLEGLYAEAAARLPEFLDNDLGIEADEPNSALVAFERGSLPVPPDGLATARISIATGSHGYRSLAVDSIRVSAHGETHRALGLFILSALLAPGANRFRLLLTHSASDVKSLLVDTMYRDTRNGGGLVTEARRAVYIPSERTHWAGEQFERSSAMQLPSISLTDQEEFVSRDWPGSPRRDTLVGFESDAGTYAIAELLLDISQSWNAALEYDLEGPQGFGGVAPDSAEIRFCLPGAFSWEPRGWDGDAARESVAG